MTAPRAFVVVLGLALPSVGRSAPCPAGMPVQVDVGAATQAAAGAQPRADTTAAEETLPDTARLFDLDRPAPGAADSTAAYGDEYDPEAADVPVDTQAVSARPVPQATLDRFRGNPAYRYDGRVGQRGPSPLERLWDWFKRTYLDPAGDAVLSRPGRTVLVIVSFVLLIALAIRLVQTGGGGLFGRRGAVRGEPGDVLLDAERIEDVDLHARLARARAAGDFRDATRYRYLLGLQRLAAAGVIVWERHKTDGDYLREVRGHARPALTTAFAEAARAFAWVWYGEAPLDAARFARVEALLDRLDAALDAAPARTRPAEATA